MMAKVSDASYSAAVRSALDTLNQYENLRHQALESAQEGPPAFQGLGVAFIERQGLAAWIVALLIPILVYTFYSIKKHYALVSKRLSTKSMEPTDLAMVANVVIVPIADIHRGSLRALQYARRLSDDVRVVTIATERSSRTNLRPWSFPSSSRSVLLPGSCTTRLPLVCAAGCEGTKIL